MIEIDPRWRTSSVMDLAASIRADKAYDRMPILADALMDAGCDNEELLTQCRTPQREEDWLQAIWRTKAWAVVWRPSMWSAIESALR